MGQEQTNHLNDTATSPEIEALLSLAETTSIVDRLLALPLVNDEFAPSGEWKRAVSKRLESRLADSMRTMIDANDRRDAA
ncbi:MAG: hypothetical protein AB7P20_10500 [Rhizobiaceae bacterium]